MILVVRDALNLSIENFIETFSTPHMVCQACIRTRSLEFLDLVSCLDSNQTRPTFKANSTDHTSQD